MCLEMCLVLTKSCPPATLSGDLTMPSTQAKMSILLIVVVVVVFNEISVTDTIKSCHFDNFALAIDEKIVTMTTFPFHCSQPHSISHMRTSVPEARISGRDK